MVEHVLCMLKVSGLIPWHLQWKRLVEGVKDPAELWPIRADNIDLDRSLAWFCIKPVHVFLVGRGQVLCPDTGKEDSTISCKISFRHLQASLHSPLLLFLLLLCKMPRYHFAPPPPHLLAVSIRQARCREKTWILQNSGKRGGGRQRVSLWVK